MGIARGKLREGWGRHDDDDWCCMVGGGGWTLPENGAKNFLGEPSSQVLPEVACCHSTKLMPLKSMLAIV